MKSMNIIFRTCANVKKTSKGGDRPFGLSKEKIILKSLKSLLESSKGFEKRLFFNIVDDSSPEEFRKKINSLMNKYPFFWRLHKISVKSNGKSMKYCYDLADKIREDLVYFCEDDYFHLKSAIPSIFDAYDRKIIGNRKFCIHPTDYPDRYIHLEPSYIFAGKNNHWRSVFSTTGTFIIPKTFFNKYKETFYEFSDFNITSTGGENITLSKIWKEVPLIAPIESFAAHLNEDTLPLYVDWKKEISKVKI